MVSNYFLHPGQAVETSVQFIFLRCLWFRQSRWLCLKNMLGLVFAFGTVFGTIMNVTAKDSTISCIPRQAVEASGQFIFLRCLWFRQSRWLCHKNILGLVFAFGTACDSLWCHCDCNSKRFSYFLHQGQAVEANGQSIFLRCLCFRLSRWPCFYYIFVPVFAFGTACSTIMIAATKYVTIFCIPGRQ